MTSISPFDIRSPIIHAATTPVPTPTAPVRWRALLWAGVVLAAVGGAAIGRLVDPPSGTGSAEPELIVLLRFMAVLKGVMAIGAVALATWRLSHPIGARLALAYVAATVLLTAGPGLIWHMATIAEGAVVFHFGLFTFLGLAWADRGGRESLGLAATARLRNRQGRSLSSGTMP